jgi:hypothetical protein
MTGPGVDFAMDIHGDEAIPANFLAGFEGIPRTERRRALPLFSDTLVSALARLPDSPGL